MEGNPVRPEDFATRLIRPEVPGASQGASFAQRSAMARLDQLTEYLFTHPGSSLTLDSEGPGYYVEASGAASRS